MRRIVATCLIAMSGMLAGAPAHLGANAVFNAAETEGGAPAEAQPGS